MKSQIQRTLSLFVMCALSAATLSGCAIAERHGNYRGGNDEDFAAYVAQRNGTAQAYDELGWAQSRELSPEERDTLDRRLQLNRLEHEIPSERERSQYFSLKPYFNDDNDRIEFLELPSFEARQRFANNKGISPNSNHFSPEVKAAVNHSDIIMGMNREAVVQSWGEPADVDVAGNKIYGNERWTYIEYVPSTDGYQKEERVLYFEGGRVVGWQKYDN